MKQLPFSDPGTPDTRSPTRFLIWVGRQQLGTLLLGMTFGIVWMLAQALLPWVLGRAIDDGVGTGDTQALLAWAGALLRARRRPGRGWDAQAPRRRQQLAAVQLPDDPGRRAPRGADRACGADAPDDGRGRRDRLQRRAPRRRGVRHHRAARRGDRFVLRRRGDPAVGVDPARPGRAARGPGPRREPVDGDPAAAGAAARAARAGGPADGGRGRHGRRAAGAARHRRRASLPRPVPQALGGGPPGRRPGGAAPGDARLRAGAPARRVRRRRHGARRPARNRGHDQRRASSSRSTATPPSS